MAFNLNFSSLSAGELLATDGGIQSGAEEQ